MRLMLFGLLLVANNARADVCAGDAQRVEYLRSQGNAAVYRVAAGNYTFSSRIKEPGDTQEATRRVSQLRSARLPALEKTLVLDESWMAQNHARIQAGDEARAAALEGLLAQAENALQAGPFTVVSKTQAPPSGDMHDYTSRGPYWWPNPDTSDGLPYVRRDGERNPEASDPAFDDRDKMYAMANTVRTLSLAWFFSGDERFAKHAACLLKTWFLDPETRMTPHLTYGQAIPGRVEGRGIGIIDTSGLAGVVDAILLLKDSPNLTHADREALNGWFRAYLKWLRHSDHGKDVARAHNNIGSWYDVQVVTFALFADDDALARRVLKAAGTRRLKAHIAPDGSQPPELDRTRTFDYSIYNLTALFQLARLGEHAGVDLWNYPGKGKPLLQAALDYLAPCADPEHRWPHAQLGTVNGGALWGLLLQGAVHYCPDTYRSWMAKRPPNELSGSQTLLLYPFDHFPTPQPRD